MKLAIMQPYFFPYIGYYQLVAAVDVFVIYDNIKYTKKGWINRNRFLRNGKEVTFSLPLKKGSDSLNIVERKLSDDFNRTKLLNQFKGAYSCAPYFAQTFSLLERIIYYEDNNLFRYIHYSLMEICSYLEINTEIRVSSGIGIDHNLKSQDKVIALCQAMCADTYVNAIGGVALYSRSYFKKYDIDLKFINARQLKYSQFDTEFMPWLSIIDMLMFNSQDEVCNLVSKYNLTGK
jgi:hypothetical protein